MSTETAREGTRIGRVAAVRGNLVRVQLDTGHPTLLMVDGSTHRVGQLGSFARLPLGFFDLYGVVVQVGADAVKSNDDFTVIDEFAGIPDVPPTGYRWMTVALFGEATGERFERGVGQYPTVGDEVHLATAADLTRIYGGPSATTSSITVGHISASGNLPASLDIASLVSRHSCIVGSTGSGKSNLVAIVLSAIADENFPAARVLVIDPHGEYPSALGERANVIRTDRRGDGTDLRVPYWALSFDDLASVVIGSIGDRDAEYLRDRVRALKVDAAAVLDPTLPAELITADSPIPFSIRALWYELEDADRSTFSDRTPSEENRLPRQSEGSAEDLVAPIYPAASPYNTAPYLNQARRPLRRQLDFMRSRILDNRFKFMFSDEDDWHPNLQGQTVGDLDSLIAAWVGSDKAVTVVDVSGLPEETIGVVVGTMLKLVYEALFWAGDLPVSGRSQPLLTVIDEAHRFLPAAGDSPAAKICERISREGRKHGMGLMTVTQRPADVAPAVLSQANTMLALRTTNNSDRSTIAATVPDDLGGLVDLLPSMRTGEGLVLGDAIAIPSRVRFFKAPERPHGDDPAMPQSWHGPRPDPAAYTAALRQWRMQSTTVGGA